jgi:hypothetical protein
LLIPGGIEAVTMRGVADDWFHEHAEFEDDPPVAAVDLVVAVVLGLRELLVAPEPITLERARDARAHL